MNITVSSSEKLRFKEVWFSCQIPPRLAHVSLEGYMPTCAEQENALEKCFGFAAAGMDNIRAGKGLFFSGSYGTGKSHLAAATLRHILELNIHEFGCPPSDHPIAGEPEYRGLTCIMVSVVDLLGLLRDSYNTEDIRRKAYRLLARARVDDVVILDDIGAEKPSDWVEEQLYALIDIRYRMRRSTFFTTNCSLKQLEAQIGNRSVSRFFEMCEGIKVGGEDWRKRIN